MLFLTSNAYDSKESHVQIDASFQDTPRDRDRREP
jgi:hypothetical protein